MRNDELPGWDDVVTAHAYESFNERHPRYREANRVLAAHAALSPGQRILDFAAGTGLTAEAALPYLGETGRIAPGRECGAETDSRHLSTASHPHENCGSAERIAHRCSG